MQHKIFCDICKKTKINPVPEAKFFAHTIDDFSETTFIVCRKCAKVREKHGWDILRITNNHNFGCIIGDFNGKTNSLKTLKERLKPCHLFTSQE